jgi:hypothetical protein
VIKRFFSSRKETADIEDAMLVAISYITHRLPLVRQTAERVTQSVLEKFPGVIWNNNLFSFLLKQMQIAVDSEVTIVSNEITPFL